MQDPMLFKPVPIIGPVQVEASLAVPAPHHNYLVGGNMVNAFALGPVGAEDDLWLVALEPPREGQGAARPIVHANLLDAFGRRLATLAGDELSFDRGGCRLERSDEELRLLQADGRAVLRVHTAWVKALGYHVSYFHCRLKDRAGVVRAEGRGAPDSPSLVLHGRAAYGIRPNATFARNDGLRDDEVRRVMALAGLAE